MRITLELANESELEKILAVLKKLSLESIRIIHTTVEETVWEKGDKSLDPRALFGIWKDRPRTIEEIRKNTWERNWNLE